MTSLPINLTYRRVAEYQFYVYITPWCRAGPWVIGIWMGYILHKLGSKEVKMSGVRREILH